MMHGKKGGVDRIVLVLIILLLFLGTLSTLFQDPLTGLQVYNATINDVREDVERLADNLPFTPETGAQACVLVDMGQDTVYSYDLTRSGATTQVEERPHSRYCDNNGQLQGPEDFVIKFTSYDALQRVAEGPSCALLEQAGETGDFHYLPSRFIQEGGMPVCDQEFSQRYCGAVRTCVDADTMRELFPCCVEREPFLQRAISPDSWIMWVAIAIGVLGIGLGAFFFIEKRSFQLPVAERERLNDYINSLRQRGYIDEQIKEHLRRAGWPDDVLDRFFPKR